MLDRWTEEIRTLAQDHLAPSSALAERAARLLEEIAGAAPAELAEAARGVARAQPAMAALVSTANVALRAYEQLGAGSVAAVLLALRRGIDSDRRAAAAALCARLQRPVRVVTTSASAAVMEALQALQREELLEDVVCGESRPLLEGTSLARWLAEQGYDVTLACDAALAEHLTPGSVFLVGTDAILPHGIANKTGTRLYATWAALAGAQRYVLATRDKLYPTELVPCFTNPDRPPGEVVQRPPVGLRVSNRAFDLTARGLWNAIWVGGSLLEDAEARGDHQTAAGLRPLLGPQA